MFFFCKKLYSRRSYEPFMLLAQCLYLEVFTGRLNISYFFRLKVKIKWNELKQYGPVVFVCLA